MQQMVPVCGFALVTILTAFPATLSAQIEMGSSGWTIGGAKPTIQFGSSVTLVDTKEKSATIILANMTDDTLVVSLTVGGRRSKSPGVTPKNGGKVNAVPGQVPPGKPSSGGSILAEGEKPRPVEAMSEDTALVNWIQALPKTVTILPGEKKSITVTLTVPADAKPGMYTAWVLASTPLPGQSGTTTSSDSKSIDPKATTKTANASARVMYRIDPAS